MEKATFETRFSLYRFQGLKPGGFQALWVKLHSTCVRVPGTLRVNSHQPPPQRDVGVGGARRVVGRKVELLHERSDDGGDGEEREQPAYARPGPRADA